MHYLDYTDIIVGLKKFSIKGGQLSLTGLKEVEVSMGRKNVSLK